VTDHLSTHARQALSEAEAVAHRLAHDYVGTEHLLAGLAHGPGAAAEVLSRCGLDGARIEGQLEELLGRGRHALAVPPPLTSSAQLAVARSRWEARALGADAVAGVHLLLAVLHQDDSTAAVVLRGLGTEPAAVEALLLAGTWTDDTETDDTAEPTRPARPEGATAGEVPAGAIDAASAPWRPDPDEPLAVQVVRLTHRVAGLEAELTELRAMLTELRVRAVPGDEGPLLSDEPR